MIIRKYQTSDEKGWVYCKALSYLFSPFFDDRETEKSELLTDIYDYRVEWVAEVNGSNGLGNRLRLEMGLAWQVSSVWSVQIILSSVHQKTHLMSVLVSIFPMPNWPLKMKQVSRHPTISEKVSMS